MVDLPELDRLIHAPMRLKICALLEGVESEPYSAIRKTLHVSEYAMSRGVRTLVDAGYLEVRADASRQGRWRRLAMTDRGRSAWADYVRSLDQLLAQHHDDGRHVSISGTER